ncbi:MAG: hypothetical protein E6Q95_02595 [Chitinophagaceae bacterium]|nr:MAG: hypothetical protein E6Q95_02595 [Chitinophagaceae bacterium]
MIKVLALMIMLFYNFYGIAQPSKFDFYTDEGRDIFSTKLKEYAAPLFLNRDSSYTFYVSLTLNKDHLNIDVDGAKNESSNFIQSCKFSEY